MLLALTALFFVTTLIFGWMALAPASAPIKTEGSRKAAASGTEQQITEVASRFTENLLNYKPATAEADIESAKRDGTAELATRQLAAFRGITLDQVVSDIREKNATSSVDVKATAITSQDEETATVLVVTQRTIDSDKRDEPTTGLLVVELTMLRSDNGWKVDDIASPTTAN